VHDDPYSPAAIARLIGCNESWGSQAARHLTILDLLSWARDPGGDFTWRQLQQRPPEQFFTERKRARRTGAHEQLLEDDFTARRGPLPLDSDEATTLWDFMRAFRHLSELEQAVVALRIMQFTEREIARVLKTSNATVHRVLHGNPARNQEGAISKLSRRMKGRS
jgi:hypothetical protein